MLPFEIALSGDSRQVVQPFDLLGDQLDAVSGYVLLDEGDPHGGGNRGDIVEAR